MTLQPEPPATLDSLTQAAINRSLEVARSGRLAEARITAEQALASGGNKAALNALIGMFLLDSGQNEDAIRHLRIAHAIRPGDIRIVTNLATALINLSDFGAAFEVSSRDLALADPTLQLARIRAFAADRLEDFEAARESLEHVVAAAPQDWESWNNLGNARRGLRDFEGSLDSFRRSLDINPWAAPTRLNYASSLRDVGRLDEADTELRKMAEDFPEDTKPLVELHAMLMELGKDEESLDAIDAAIRRDPGNIELLLVRAGFLSNINRMEPAEAAYRRVLELEPLNGLAHLGLALVYELTNRLGDLDKLIAEASEHEVDPNVLNFMRAYLHLRKREFDRGLEVLSSVPEHVENPRRLHLLGQLLEGAGSPDEAFEAFSRMNELSWKDPTAPEERAARYRDAIRRSQSIVTEEWAGKWRKEAREDPRPAPTFLVGFPRSGTTLLDTILLSHPNIEVLEEEPALSDASEMLSPFEELPTIDERKVSAARDAYFAKAQALTPLAPGNLLIDKNPLNMNLLPVVRRIFPEARIILALRHPCDVVLSCFVANFRLNDGMSSFIRLDTTAELYDLSFSNFEHVQRLMPMPTHVVKYEDIVEDRETELRQLFDFLRLDWHEAVLDHQSTAISRGRIKTASYAQVIEPIYKRSAGRWNNYRKHLEPVLPVLAPWIEKFGYTV